MARADFSPLASAFSFGGISVFALDLCAFFWFCAFVVCLVDFYSCGRLLESSLAFCLLFLGAHGLLFFCLVRSALAPLILRLMQNALPLDLLDFGSLWSLRRFCISSSLCFFDLARFTVYAGLCPCLCSRVSLPVCLSSTGLRGGAPTVSLSHVAVTPWTLPFSPLPNLGNTCWLAALVQLFRACDLDFPFYQACWRDTVDHLTHLGFHNGSQQDPRLFLAHVAALFPDWTSPLMWTFKSVASCSRCASVRSLPSDDHFVVDLAVPNVDSCLPDLLATWTSVNQVPLDCAHCSVRLNHSIGAPSVEHLCPSVIFHIRRSVGGSKLRSIVRVPSSVQWFGSTFKLVGAVLHLGDSPDFGHYITLLPPSSTSSSWTCFDDGRCLRLLTPSSQQWHLNRDATLLLYSAVTPPVASVHSRVSSSIHPSVPAALNLCDSTSSLGVPPLQLVIANITSWFAGWPQLLNDHTPCGACIWLLCETHLSPSASRACLTGLHRRGLHGLFKCNPTSSLNSKDCKSSGYSSMCGVAIVSSLPLREVGWSSEKLQQLTLQGRLLHATAAISGSQPFHLIIFYGFSRGTTCPEITKQNEDIITDVAAECQSWGRVPLAFAGDFNVHLSNSLAVSNLLSHGRWVDVACAHADRNGISMPPPTCFANPLSSKGTRIDGILLNPVAATCFMDLSYPVSGLPSHQPLVVDLQISPLNALITKHKAPRRATHDPGRSVPCSADTDLHVAKLWQSVAADWQRARNTGDTQSLWPLLTRVGHDFYCWFSGLKVSTKAVCRGLPGEPCSFRVPPPRCRAFDTATSIQNAARQRFTRALEHVARLRLRLADDCTSADRFHEFQHHWLRVAARSSKFVDSADWFALFGSGILRVSQPQSWPSFDSIVQLVRQLEIESSKILALERSSRLNAWRQTCRRNWRDPKQKRFVYSWIRDAWPLPVASVRVPETNQISMNPTDIERVLWQKWQPIFCPSPDQEAVPDFNAFWERFGRYAVHAPVT